MSLSHRIAETRPPSLHALDTGTIFQSVFSADEQKSYLGHSDQYRIKNRLKQVRVIGNAGMLQLRHPNRPVRGVTLKPVGQHQIPEHRGSGTHILTGEANTISMGLNDREQHGRKYC